MKRLLFLGSVLVMLVSCERRDTYNDIAYPVSIQLSKEIPGDPITLMLWLTYHDQTPDSSGEIFDWEIRGDTLWFLLQGKDVDIDDNDGPYDNNKWIDVGVLENGVYTLLLEGDEGMSGTLSLTVEDSLYHLVGDSSDVLAHKDQTLRRIFPDMLLVEVGARQESIDSVSQALIEIGAVECKVSAGSYTMFNVFGSGSTWAVYGNRATSEEWSWYMDYAGSLLFTFDGDSMLLDSVFHYPPISLNALSMRRGNGFERYYRWWFE